MKRILSIALLFTFFLPQIATAQQTELAKLLQQMEILRYEISVLQSLLKNMQAQQPVQAKAYVAVDLTNGSILLQKNVSTAYPIASVTKLMSAIIEQETISPSQTITLTEQMLQPLGKSPVFFTGATITAENLFKAMLIQSSNDAAQALASANNANTFVVEMNKKAQTLGMTDTSYADPHGLNPANHSTASDLAKLVTYIYEKHPEILNTTKENNFWLPDSSGRLLKFQNVNNFYPLPYFLGGKTGYLVEAQQTLAAVFQVTNKPVALVVLGSPNRQADVFSLLKQLN